MNAFTHSIAAAVALVAVVDRKALLDTMTKLKKVVEARSTMPILSCALIEATPDKLDVIGTNLDQQLATELPAATAGGFAFAVDVRDCQAALKSMKGETVRLESLAGRLELRDPDTGAKLSLATRDPADFPRLKAAETSVALNYHAGWMAQALGRTAVAMSKEETRYYLRGVFVHAECVAPPPRTAEHESAVQRLHDLRAERETRRAREARGEEHELPAEDEAEQIAAASALVDKMEAERTAPDTVTLAATDGHRLVRYRMPLRGAGVDPAALATMPGVIIPDTAIRLAIDLIGKRPDGFVDLEIAAARVAIRIGRWRLLSKVVDGTFPDYRRVIPSDCANSVTVAAAALSSMAKSIASVSNEKTRAVGLSFGDGQPLVISANSAENGPAAGTVDVEASKGEGVIGFNETYIRAFADLMDAPLTIHVSDAAGPARFESGGDACWLGVLMPMRTDVVARSVGDVERLNMTPLDRLNASGGDKTLSRIERGHLIRDAVAYLVQQGKARRAARLTVAGMAAILADEPHDRLLLLSRADNGHAARSIDAMRAEMAEEAKARDPMEIVRRSHAAAIEADADGLEPETVDDVDEHGLEPETLADYDPEPETPLEMPDREEGDLPVEATPEPAALEPEEHEPDPVVDVPAIEETAPEPDQGPDTPPALDPPALKLADAAPGLPAVYGVKIETVYGHVIFVDAGDYASDKPMLRRLHKSGAPFTDSEARGGAWQRICRENIKRRILPRNSPAKPVVVADKAAETTLAERVAKLERIIAGDAVAIEAADQTAEIERLKAALAKSEADREEYRERFANAEARNTSLASSLKATTRERDEARADRDRLREAYDGLWTRRMAKRRVAKAAARYRKLAGDAVATRNAALANAARLQVRCDALETLAANSAALDVRPAGEGGGIILPLVPSSKRREAVG